MIDKEILSWLTNCPASDGNFKSNLKGANIETIEKALEKKELSKTAIQKLNAELRRKLKG